MTLKTFGAVSALLSLCAPATAQTIAPAVEAAPAAIATPLVAQAPQAAPVVSLPANTEVLLSMNEDLTSKGGRIDEGHKFNLTVVHDVLLNGMIVIPKGTPATGEVTWLTGKGAFGKSGKMEIELRQILLNGRAIPISGKYRQEGEGNTVATVAGVVAAGVFAAFITGKSARIPQGRELKAYTKDALAVAMPANAPTVAPAVQAIPAAATPAPAAAPAAATSTTPAA